jgi:hypothetical protein
LIEHGHPVRGEDLKQKSVFLHSFATISPWRKGIHFIRTNVDPHTPKDALFQVWLKLVLWFWRSQKCKKLTDRRGDQKSSLELSAQVSQQSEYMILALYTSYNVFPLSNVTNLTFDLQKQQDSSSLNGD